MLQSSSVKGSLEIHTSPFDLNRKHGSVMITSTILMLESITLGGVTLLVAKMNPHLFHPKTHHLMFKGYMGWVCVKENTPEMNMAELVLFGILLIGGVIYFVIKGIQS